MDPSVMRPSYACATLVSPHSRQAALASHPRHQFTSLCSLGRAPKYVAGKFTRACVLARTPHWPCSGESCREQASLVFMEVSSSRRGIACLQ